jgi:hypothetical protein
MAEKKLLVDLKNALLIAQAGIKATLKSLTESRPRTKKRTAKKSTAKKMSPSLGERVPKAKGRPMAKARRTRTPSKARNRKSTS